jgi:hypothetical protein
MKPTGFLFKRKRSFDGATDSPTDNQKVLRLTLLLKIPIPADRGDDKRSISTIEPAT